LHEGAFEVAPGIEVRRGTGHTVGHQVTVVQGGGDGLVFTGDTVATTAHLRLPYVMGFDLFPLSTLEEKRSLLAEICAHGWALAFDHDPAVAAARLREEGRGDYAVAEAITL